MTLEERAKEYVSKRASGTAQEMDYYANLLVEFANETTEYLKIELATSEHDREHDEYELVETYEKISGLEKENAELKTRVENQKSFLERIRAKFELGEIDRKEIEGYLESEQLTEAKEIICLGLRAIETNGKCNHLFVEQAEQFLNNEVEK